MCPFIHIDRPKSLLWKGTKRKRDHSFPKTEAKRAASEDSDVTVNQPPYMPSGSRSPRANDDERHEGKSLNQDPIVPPGFEQCPFDTGPRRSFRPEHRPSESPWEDYQPYADGLLCYESEDIESEDLESEDVESEDVQPRKMCKFLGLVFLEVTQHTT